MDRLERFPDTSTTKSGCDRPNSANLQHADNRREGILDKPTNKPAYEAPMNLDDTQPQWADGIWQVAAPCTAGDAEEGAA